VLLSPSWRLTEAWSSQSAARRAVAVAGEDDQRIVAVVPLRAVFNLRPVVAAIVLNFGPVGADIGDLRGRKSGGKGDERRPERDSGKKHLTLH
jgi:hypothetical protein